jgi:ubiquinone/menaquinone biosynthesis C-methylase UbiE
MARRVTPFRVFESGPGEIPCGAIGQALKSNRRGLNREFTAVDVALRAEEALRQRGLREAPRNLKLVRNCAVAEMMKLSPESQDIVFGSYFLNNYSTQYGEENRELRTIEYLHEAKRIIKPRGRIILIQDQLFAEGFAQTARRMGLKVSVVKLPPKLVEASTAEYIKYRRSEERRRELLEKDMKKKPAIARFFKEFVEQHKLKDPTEAYWPTAIIMRK